MIYMYLLVLCIDQILQENHTDFSMTKDCKEIGGKFKIIPLCLNLFEEFHNFFRSIVRL